MIDPVSGFVYPDSWVERCFDKHGRHLAETGFGVLTATGTVLRRGFTTGSTAAAAAYAATASLAGANITKSPVVLPCGILAKIPAHGYRGVGTARKYAGDYPSDSTAGILICAAAEPADDIHIEAGYGIGRFVRDTPRYRNGAAAISPPAFREISAAVAAGCKAAGLSGANVLLTIPSGKKIGATTLHPKIGVEGGISVVGTTGFVEPWDDHLCATIEERIAKSDKVVITTGRTGLRYSRMLFPSHEAILSGSKISVALNAAQHCQSVVVCGLPGLILRYFNPDAAVSRGFATVEELMASPTGKFALNEELARIKTQYPTIRVVIISREGQVMGDSL